jgi:protein-disulfide isomerase
MKTTYYTIITIAAIGLLATSILDIQAMEQKPIDTEKAMTEKKAMAEKKTMTEKKAMAEKKIMANKANISELRKLVSNIEKSLTPEEKSQPEIKSALTKLKTAITAMDKAMSGKAMAEKKVMEGKEHTSDKMLKIGGIDLSQASPVLGSSNAKITIIEFGDYQCPKCNQWFKSEGPKLKSQYISTNKANLYFVDFAWLGSDSELAAQATHCADEQGKFWQYHDALYTNQGGIQSGWANASALKKFAKSIGLDTTKFDQCLESGRHKPHVEFNTSLGEDNGVTATPVFFIVGNGKVEKITGPQPVSAFTSVIEKMLK